MAANEKSYPGALPRDTILNERYRILETVGRGGFGMIYRVENRINKKIYSVKEYFNLDFMHRSEADHKSVIYEDRHRRSTVPQRSAIPQRSVIPQRSTVITI